MNPTQTALKICRWAMPEHYRPPANVLFPFAHIVSDCPPAHVKHLYDIPTISKFKSDLGYLCRQFKPLQVDELDLLSGHRAKTTPGRRFILSFDDGMREVYDVVAPILREKGIPALFYLNSATIDNKRMMWRHKVSLLVERFEQGGGPTPPQLRLRPGQSVREKLKDLRFCDEAIVDDVAKFLGVDFNDYLRRFQPYLTTDQILRLARDGFEFGGHSDSHPYFHELGIDEQKRQIGLSVDFIRGLGLRCRSFAFPFHDMGVPMSVFNYMADLGLVLSFGTSEARVDSVGFSFQRFSIDARGIRNSKLRDVLKELTVKSFARRASGTEIIQRI